jgi:S-adenosylmethionine synthetase
MEKILFTSESVSSGHPDKLCDQISDAILDECLRVDPNARVACECYITTNLLIIGGEIKVNGKVDYERIARDVICNVGYINEEWGIDGKTCEIKVVIDEQSNDIALGVDIGGAGDQGIMFGYATNETSNYMPLPISIAHDLILLATKLRKEKVFKDARSDMKSQVTIDYTDPSNLRIDTILMSIQHNDTYQKKEFEKFIKENIMDVIAKKYQMNTDYKYFINPTGRFVIGGPKGDTGLTGRKIVVDTYGGASRIGGGAFSGKDATKVDRSASYMARYITKNLVAAGICDKCELQLSYGIGIDYPLSIYIETFNTEKISKDKIIEIIKNNFDLTPKGIIKTLNLNKPIYFQTSVGGHFGRDIFTWEKLDMVDKLREKFKII